MSETASQSKESNQMPSPTLEARHDSELLITAPVLYRSLPSKAVLSIAGESQAGYVNGLRDSALQGAADTLNILAMKDTIEKYEIDTVSGLMNETSWMNRYPEYVKRSEYAAEHGEDAGLVVLSIDMDSLKLMNDLTGSHTAGDRYFRIVGDALKHSGRLGDENYRKSKGDELAVILWGVEPDINEETGKADYESTINRIVSERVEAVKQALVAEGLDPNTYGISAGGAHHELGQTPEDLFVIADAAMYEMKRMKRAGRN